jgi:hypothetical protein
MLYTCQHMISLAYSSHVTEETVNTSRSIIISILHHLMAQDRLTGSFAMHLPPDGSRCVCAQGIDQLLIAAAQLTGKALPWLWCCTAK